MSGAAALICAITSASSFGVRGRNGGHNVPTTLSPGLAATNAIANAGLAANLQATESGPNGQVGNGHLRLASATPGETSSVVIAGGAFGGLAASIHMGLANGGREFTGAAQFRPAVVADAVPATPGVDGTRGGAIDVVGIESAKTGMYALLDVDLFNILC